MSVLESATSALRDGASGEDRADATRARLVRSLERRAHRHRQVVTLVTLLVVMFGATASWAWSTGRLETLFGTGARPRPVERAQPPSVEPPPPVERASPQPESWPVPSEAAPPPPPPPVAKRATANPSRPAEVLYRRAHELHFHGEDRAAALAAWDAYLAAESTGTFAIEARFNRGIVLARLGRYADALAALDPYARGEVAGGYRRVEAEQLVTRLRALIEAP